MADQKINGALYRSMVIEGALAIAEKEGTGKRTERYSQYRTAIPARICP